MDQMWILYLLVPGEEVLELGTVDLMGLGDGNADGEKVVAASTSRCRSLETAYVEDIEDAVGQLLAWAIQDHDVSVAVSDWYTRTPWARFYDAVSSR